MLVTTSVEFFDERGEDQVELNGKVATGTERERVVELLKLVRKGVKRRLGRAQMVSSGDFPTSAGLASSAAAFAALAVAARAGGGAAARCAGRVGAGATGQWFRVPVD